MEYACQTPGCSSVLVMNTFDTKAGQDWGKKPIKRPSFSATAPSSHGSEHHQLAHLLPELPTAVGNNVARKAVVAFLMSNPIVSHEHYADAMKAQGLEPLGRESFDAVHAEFGRACSNDLCWQMEVAGKDAMSGKYALGRTNPLGVVITLDCRFANRGHHSPHATNCAVCANNNCIVGATHVSLRGSANPEDCPFSVQYRGTAKGSESFGAETLSLALNARGVRPDTAVVDGDGGVALAMRAGWGNALKILPCVNHYLKAEVKKLIAAFKTKPADCTCSGRPHKLIGQGCGCGRECHALHFQSLVHGMISASVTPEEFRCRVIQLIEHFQGKHDNCTWHPRRRCSGCSPPCESYDCDCGKCSPGPRKCFGNTKPREPKCEGELWVSTLPPITCDKDVRALAATVHDLSSNAENIVIEGHEKPHTCRNESLFGRVAKGFN